ncbi:MAG: hypothetical protein GY917_30545 [Planctomycetaceae bacterium]|nr:hypothetical protein [Planctomycetaceae bacterium]
MNQPTWPVIDETAPVTPTDNSSPLEALAAGEIGAIICRDAFTQADCQSVVRQLVSEELLYDPEKPIPDKFREIAVPENYYYRAGQDQTAFQDHMAAQSQDRMRIDVGTSLGTRASDPDAFFAHAAGTHDLFRSLYGDQGGPVATIYDQLSLLAGTKKVHTAHEADGRLYGPAIFRAHYGGFTYKPHYDSVRHREKRTDYAVYDFEHQFAGVLVLQNTEKDGQTAQSRLHRCFWNPEVDPHLNNDTFHEYARDQGIASLDVILNPGDLYFFNTGCIHEVPGIAGDSARIVLATFIGYSSDRPDIYVWS